MKYDYKYYENITTSGDIEVLRKALLDLGSKFRKVLMVSDKMGAKLMKAKEEIKVLRGILPYCPTCGKIKDMQKGEWSKVEDYLNKHTEAAIALGECNSCSSTSINKKSREIKPGIKVN